MHTWKTWMAGIAWSSIFGFSFLMTKGALGAFSPFELLFLRFVLATAALTVVVRLGYAKLSYRGKPLGTLALLCLFQPVLYFACETYGVKGTASSTAGLVLGALPAAVAALSAPLLKERLRAGQVAGLVVSVAGVVLIVLAGARGGDPGKADSPLGILLLVGALASAAFYNVFSRKGSTSFSPVETTFAMMASGAVFFGILTVVERLAGGGAAAGAGILARATPEAWLAVAYLGILSSVVAFFLVNYTLQKLKASQSAVFGTLTTLVALAAGVVFRGEYAGPLQLAGAAMIVAGVWATNAPGRKAGIPG